MSVRRWLVLLVACLSVAAPAATAAPIAIVARRIGLHSEYPGETRIGRLEFLGGLALASPDRRFGGYSGLEVRGDRLIAVSDLGHWLTARLEHDRSGRLIGLAEGDIAPLLDPAGRPLKAKRESDAESLRIAGDLALVTFERDHRLWWYRGWPPVSAPAAPVANPPGLDLLPENGGIEAAAILPHFRLLLISEGGRRPDGDLRTWYGDREGWYEIAYATSGQFVPTDAAALRNGDVFVLERRYRPLDGVAARLVRIAAEKIRPGARLEGEEVAEIAPPLNVDNMEGLALHEAEDGGVTLYLMSDDNRNPLQRTLLMQFRLRP
jgi:hypothetical protein